MAMEKHYVVRDTHTRSITAIGYHPVRREIVLGYEDGTVKSWEAESGQLLQSSCEHKGWVTDFVFWSEAKVMLSSSNDAHIVVWSSGAVADVINMKVPIYCMTIYTRRQQLICGVHGGVKVYALDKEKERGHFIRSQPVHISQEHTDIVRCVISHESRIYSAGYDQRLVIYDSSYTQNKQLNPLFNNIIHDAGIASMVLAKHNDNNMWLITGSFDKSVKVWSLDGKLVHKIDVFLSTVTGMCYISRNKTVWAAGGTSYPTVFDPKSGDNVSDFTGTNSEDEEDRYQLEILKFFPELNQVVASSNHSHLVVWKYNSSGCLATLSCRSRLESLCYTSKVPILIFSGDHNGTVTKWERMQSNHFMYSHEAFTLNDAKLKKKTRIGSKTREMSLQQDAVVQKTNSETGAREHTLIKQNLNQRSLNTADHPLPVAYQHQNTTVLKILFIESMDLILAASEDSNIYVWGFDEAAVSVLQNMKPQGQDLLIQKYGALLDSDSDLTTSPNSAEITDSVTNRVAGFVLQCVLSEHISCVTSLVLVGREQGVNGTYILSAGWDRKISLWDMEARELKDTFRTDADATDVVNELASDQIITDMDFNPTQLQFAYSSADKMVYIRKFSTTGSKMSLINTLQGHEAEVTCVRWNNITHMWVTGSEDGTIRIWSGEGMNDCQQILVTQGAVTCLCVDIKHGSIVAGVLNSIKIFDAEQYRLVQNSLGHTDSVRSIIHVPERNQYVSCSWDGTIRVWNAWQLPRRKLLTTTLEEKT